MLLITGLLHLHTWLLHAVELKDIHLLRGHLASLTDSSREKVVKVEGSGWLLSWLMLTGSVIEVEVKVYSSRFLRLWLGLEGIRNLFVLVINRRGHSWPPFVTDTLSIESRHGLETVVKPCLKGVLLLFFTSRLDLYRHFGFRCRA